MEEEEKKGNVDRIRRRVYEILGKASSTSISREKLAETLKYSRRISEELRRELFGDTLFVETVVVSLIILSVVTLVADYMFPAGSAQAESIYRLDLLICVLLGIEFIYRLYRSGEPRAFIRKYWYELLALTPAYLTAMVNVPLLAGFLRMLRLVRVYRVYRVLGRENIYLYMIVDIIREARLLQLLTIFIIGLGFTSVFAFLAEARTPGSTIKSLSDAFWWSLATVTTVGYGDIVPVTTVGKIVGVFLMLFGIAILGGFISLTSTSVMRVLTKYQEVMKNMALRNDYLRLRDLTARITDLSDEEYGELLELLEKFREVKEKS